MKNLFTALAKFQQEVPILHKDAKGYGYNYTPLATIVEKINPLLKKHGLGFYQGIEHTSIKTVIFHSESGESIESITNMPVESLEYIPGKNKKGEDIHKILGFEGMNKAQAYGSLVTYFRRYALSSILGLVTDTDADARNKRIDAANKPLPELKANSENFTKVLQALTNGYTIEQIKTKYTISEDVEIQLLAGS